MQCFSRWTLWLPAALILAACAGEEETGEPPRPVSVTAAALVDMREREELDAIGTARAVTAAELYPEAAGLVTAVAFRSGDRVRKGAVLVELDARRERLAVELARVAVKEAEQLLGRYRRIEKTGALSESQIEAGETAVESARLELQQAQVALADRTIRAPFSGHMGLPQVDRGDRITPASLIATIDDRSRLFVDFPAPERLFGTLRPGSRVSLQPYSDPSRTVDARIAGVDSAISPDTRTFTVRAVIPNVDDAFRPGMSFRARFDAAGRMRPSAPEEAVVWGSDGPFIWAVDDGKARRVRITIAGRRDGRVLIDGALDRVDRIIVQGVNKVRDGQTVRLVEPFEKPPVTATPAPAATDGAGL